MATKKKARTAVDDARDLVREADAAEQKSTDNSTESCGCNASTLPHKHVSRGIVDLEPVKVKAAAEEEEEG